ncbi:hypothetical protein Tco_0572240 [Tanacetum coccineum]
MPSKQSKPAPATKPKVTPKKPSEPSHAKHPKRGKVQKVRKRKSPLKLIDEDEEVHHEPEPEGVGKNYDLNLAIQMSLETFQAHGQALVDGVAIHEQVEEATRQLLVVEGKGKQLQLMNKLHNHLLHGLQELSKHDSRLGFVRNYEFLVPTGSTQFLLAVKFSLPGLLESPGLMENPTDLDESQMTYGPKQTHTSDSEPKTSDLDSCESNSSVESLESMPKPVIIEPKTSEYAPCKSNLSAESLEFIPKSVCARNESVRKADNPRKNNKSPRVLHGSSPFLGANGLTSPRVNGYLYKVPTGSTQFLLVVRFSLSGLLENSGLMESIKLIEESWT